MRALQFLLEPAVDMNKSDPQVIVQVVAARNRSRAKEFVKYSIPDVRDIYQEILEIPDIEAIFISLPNWLHYESAFHSTRAGKHLLVEKPSTNNETEAKILFNPPEPSPSQTNAPVLLGFH